MDVASPERSMRRLCITHPSYSVMVVLLPIDMPFQVSSRLRLLAGNDLLMALKDQQL